MHDLVSGSSPAFDKMLQKFFSEQTCLVMQGLGSKVQGLRQVARERGVEV